MKTKEETNNDGELTPKKKKKWSWVSQKYLRLKTPSKKKNIEASPVVVPNEANNKKTTAKTKIKKKDKGDSKSKRQSSKETKKNIASTTTPNSTPPDKSPTTPPRSSSSYPTQKRLFPSTNNNEITTSTTPQSKQRTPLSTPSTPTHPIQKIDEPWTPSFPHIPPPKNHSNQQQHLHLSHLKMLSREHISSLPFDNDMLRHKQQQVVSTSQIQTYNHVQSELSLAVKTAMGRVFQRPPHKWQVTVNDPAWDHSLERYSYRIIVCDRTSSPSCPPHTQMRTLQDFCWLESALRQEYQGALLCPLLHLHLGVKKLNFEERVSGRLLGTWLEDVLNGWRCNGEYVLPPPPTQSESLETFLYLTPQPPSTPPSPTRSLLAEPCTTAPCTTLRVRSTPISLLSCRSRAEQQSLIEMQSPLSFLSSHCLSLSRQTTKTSTLLSIVIQHETRHISLWKRFAISLSNLFKFEKDVETAKIGAPHPSPLSKEDIDDGLRILARGKADRSLPALHLLSALLDCHSADLASAIPNLNVLTYDMQRTRSDAGKEELLHQNSRVMASSLPLRMARMSWKYLKREGAQAHLLQQASVSLLNLHSPRISTDVEDGLDEVELGIVERIEALGEGGSVRTLVEERVGRWDAEVALKVMEAAGVGDAEVRVEETTRELRLVRKYAIGLRGCLERCVEAVEGLMSGLLDGTDEEENRLMIKPDRDEFWKEMTRVFASVSTTKGDLQSMGVDNTDPAGWITPSHGNCGAMLQKYISLRDANLSRLLHKIATSLTDYTRRVESIESFVYMHCVGIQLEKHFSQVRKTALTQWENKTDITTAINIATRKKLPALVDELKLKLEGLERSGVSHTVVKIAKERHLASKSLKQDLADLALKRFQRVKQVATRRVLNLVTLWAEYEESGASEELKAIGEAIREIERNVTMEQIQGDGGAHELLESTTPMTPTHVVPLSTRSAR